MKHSRETFWWRNSNVFELNSKGFSQPRQGAELWYKWFWYLHENVAWYYELVRRFGESRCPQAQGEEWIKELPPYPELTIAQQDALWREMPDQFKALPEVITNLTNVQPLKSEYLPREPVAYHQQVASAETVIKTELRERGNRKHLQPKQKRWDLIEMLDGRCPGARRRERTRLLTEAKEVMPFIRTGWMAARVQTHPLPALIDSCLPYISGISGRIFSREQLQAAIRKASSEKQRSRGGSQ